MNGDWTRAITTSVLFRMVAKRRRDRPATRVSVIRKPKNHSSRRTIRTRGVHIKFPSRDRIVTSKRSGGWIDEIRQRCENRFKQTPPPLGFPKDITPPPRRISIDWATSSVPSKAIERVEKLVMKRGEFGWLSDSAMEVLAARMESEPMTLEQAMSLRSAMLQQKTVRTFHRLQRKAKEIRRIYEDQNKSILEISREYDFPPVNIFRAILTARGWSKNRIKESLKNPTEKLSERDRTQFQLAEDADRVSNVDQSETLERADLFEEVLADHFTTLGVRFLTQLELVKAQYKEHGRPLRTPDLLFLDHVIINGQPVAWVDAKHFFGADIDFQRRKTKKQMNRYQEEWGQGAIIYRHGFAKSLRIPGTILLDSSPLNLSKMLELNGGDS